MGLDSEPKKCNCKNDGPKRKMNHSLSIRIKNQEMTDIKIDDKNKK
jgi:hypothetical protein